MKHYDLVIVGGGVVGATLAALAGRLDRDVALIEKRRPPQLNPDADTGLRVSAISPGAQAILSEAGAWRLLDSERAGPGRPGRFQRMHVEAAGGGDGLDFDAAEMGCDVLGYIADHERLTAALWDSLEAGGRVDLYARDELASFSDTGDRLHLTTVEEESLSCTLLVAADGAHSRIRRQLGIGQSTRHYNQTGVVATVATAETNPMLAWQRFLETGPLAFLPLSDGRSSIVWSQPHRDAEDLLALDEESFLDELNAASGNLFGGAESTSARAGFPLTMRLADADRRGRVVLLGDAAHVVHPLAGQGLNLGILDAAALVEKLTQRGFSDSGLERALNEYSRWRRSENRILMRSIDMLHGLFSLPQARAGWLKRLGLKAAGSHWALRKLFYDRASGQYHGAPRLARGDRLRDLRQSV